MTKEETKEAIKIMQAYCDGKQIQYRDYTDDVWQNTNDPIWDFYTFVYRIKPEPKLRPYTFKEMCEAVLRHGGYVVNKDKTVLNHINVANVRGVFPNHHANFVYEYNELLEKFVWLDDNSPCGIMEE